MSKIAWVVHRYYPFPGGSENNVRNVAEAMVELGHEVIVWAPINHGDQNGVKVTSNPNVLLDPSIDLAIIHGAGPHPQNMFINSLDIIPAKTVYFIIKPEETPYHIKALHECNFIAASTPEDYQFVNKYNVKEKTINVRYGILEKEVYGKPTFRDKYNLPKDKKMFLSCGGYWYNKAMKELANDFIKANLDDSFLVTTGYNLDHTFMPTNTDNVFNYILEDRQDVLNAMADSDCYIMNSFEEGYGIVLLEAMFNKKMWLSRNIAAGSLLSDRGFTYTNSEQLIDLLHQQDKLNVDLEANYQYVKLNHTSTQTALDLLEVLK